ncbi:MAG: phosphoribosylanthranilate isomerase [Bacteroidota bacterium]
MRVKICGITRIEDALYAADEGADAVGFIFVRTSPRYVTPEAAAAIVRHLPPFVTPVGVFVNEGRESIRETIEVSRIRCLQFHGEESPSELEEWLLPVIKSFRIGNGLTPPGRETYHADAYLLDTYVSGIPGGTGKTFDWSVARSAAAIGPIILSGGLNPLNVGEAIRAIRPYAVDVSSGVESAPGVKDRYKIREFFDAVRRSADQRNDER